VIYVLSSAFSGIFLVPLFSASHQLIQSLSGRLISCSRDTI